MTLTVPRPEVPDLAKGLRSFSTFHLAAEVLRSPNFGNGRPHDAWMAGTLPVVDGAEHLARRRIESKLFTPAAVERYEREMLRPQLERFVRECTEAAVAGQPFRGDLHQLGVSWLTQISARIAGIDGIDDDASGAALRALTEGVVARYAKVDEEGRRAIERDTDLRRRRFEREMFLPSAQRRRTMLAEVQAGRRSADDLPHDVLTMLLAADAPTWDDELPLREVLVYLAGSIRTTARSLVHVTGHLDAWFTAHPEDRASRLDRTFLRGAVNESLRLHPVLPVLLRQAQDRVVLSDGTVIDAGERVAVLFGEANRDPAVFGERPDDFDPRRHERLDGAAGYGMAFALGSHSCIGRRLAMGTGDDRLEGSPGTLLSMVTMLQRLGVRLDPDDPPVYDTGTFYDEYVRFPILLDTSAETEGRSTSSLR